MQKKGKERAARCERRPSLTPASVEVRSVALFQAEAAGEGSSTAVPATLRRVLATPGRETVREQKYLFFTEKVISHPASVQVGVIWFFTVTFAFTNANFYASIPCRSSFAIYYVTWEMLWKWMRLFVTYFVF